MKNEGTLKDLKTALGQLKNCSDKASHMERTIERIEEAAQANNMSMVLAEIQDWKETRVK